MAKGDRITLILADGGGRVSLTARRAGGEVRSRLLEPIGEDERQVLVEEINAARSENTEKVLRSIYADEVNVLAVIRDTDQDGDLIPSPKVSVVNL